MGRLLWKMENDGVVFSLWLLCMQVDTSQRSFDAAHDALDTTLATLIHTFVLFASLCYNGIGGIVT